MHQRNIKKLQLNTEKSKMICFKRGGGRRKKINCKWEGQKIEEVKELKYLEFVVTYNGSKEGQRVEEKGGRSGEASIGAGKA